MSGPFGSSPWGYNPGGDFYSYTIDQSLRFDDGDSAHLDRTYSSSAGGNTKTWTWSSWVKIGNISAQKMIFSGSTNTSNLMYLQLRGDAQDNRLDITWRQGSSTTRQLSTNRQFRDVSAWYHIVWAVDTTQATDSNKMRLYINGVEETSFSADNRSTISQDSDLIINANSAAHSIGTYSQSPSSYFDGYMAEMHFVDGTQLDSTSFGETKDGIWIPKKYTGSHGTTGFYLPFDDSSAIGDDESANTNDWTPSGLVASDVVLDSPTNNFATLNPLDNYNTGATLSEGNLKWTIGAADGASRSTYVMTAGKWYVEFLSNNDYIGVVSGNASIVNMNGTQTVYYAQDGTKRVNGSSSSYGASYADGSIIGIALDLDASPQTVNFYKNNAAQGSLNLTDVGNEGYSVSCGSGSGSTNATANFGQDSTFAGATTAGGNQDDNGVGDFKYAPPSGFLALCSQNLPDVAIIDGTDNFNTVLYTGDGSNGLAISGVGFSPDWTWIKSRGGTAYHELHDSVRGAGKRLFSNDTAAESDVGTVSSFDSDGFTVSRNSSYDGTNQNSQTFVAWNWLAGTAFSNDASATGVGTVDSSGQVNTTAGFSIVTFTGGAAGYTVAHGLSAAPEIIFTFNRTDSGGAHYVFTTAIDGTIDYFSLNATTAKNNDPFSMPAFTSTVFSLDNDYGMDAGDNCVAYCFHSVEGYSKIGSYVGNGNANGPFVFTGFRPAWIMIKETTNAASWYIQDSTRDVDNPVQALYPIANDTLAENSSWGDIMDLLSNGFKPSVNDTAWNRSGGTYIYIAFAEQPFKFANAR